MNDIQVLSELAATPVGLMLIWAHENPGKRVARHTFDDKEVVEAARYFLTHELLDGEQRLSGPWELTARGHRIATQLSDSMRSGPLRRAAVQKALLHLVDEAEVQYTDDIIGKDVEGVAVTEREHTHAVSALLKWGLMEGAVSFGNGGLNSPEVTPLGREAADDPRPPVDFVNNGGTTIYDYSKNLTNHGQMGAGAVGEQVSQKNITVNAESSEAGDIVARIRAYLEQLEDVPEEAWPALATLEDETRALETTKPKLQAGYGAFTAAIMVKLADDSYAGIRDLVTNLGALIAGM